MPGRPSIWIHEDYYPDRGTDGDIRGFLVCYANVDQLKRLELEAGGREHRLRLVTDSVGSPIIHFDRNLKLRFANKPFGDWVGIAPDDLLGRRMQELIAGGTFADMDEHIDRAFSGAKVSFERRERKSTGELRWVRITLFPDRAVGGRVDGIFAVMTDIDDDVGIRDALRAQEVQLRLFADNIPGPIAYLDRASTYTFVNQAFANWVQLPQEQIYGRTPFEVLAPSVASFLRPVLERAHGGEHVEYERVDSPDGAEERWVHGRVAPDFDADGKLRGIYCTEYDIHDLKRTEQALAKREEQLRLFTDNIPDPVVYLDTERRYSFVNDAFLQLNGLDRAAVIGKTTAEVIGLEATTHETPYQDRAFAGETVSYERALVDASGRSRWIRGRMVPDHRIDGAIQGVYVVLHDITDLKVAQDTLAKRESQLRAVMDGVPAPVAYIDRAERCQYVNRALLQYFGVAAEEVATLRLRDVIGSQFFESAQAKIARALEGESAEFDRLIPGANGAVAVDDDPRGPGLGAVRRRAGRVRADERHPRPEAGAGGAARLRIRAQAHHGQRAGARRLHRSRLPVPLPQPPQRGMARSEARRAQRPRGGRRRRRRALRADASAARARAAGRDGLGRATARATGRRGALGVGALRAEPRLRRTGHRHLRRAHGRARPEAERGRAAPRQLDALVAHQQHAARGARVGPRLPPRALVAAGGGDLRLARRGGARHADRRQPAAARRRPRRRRRAAEPADER